MSKKYDLELCELWEFEGYNIGYYSKGHHDKKEFADALKCDYEVEVNNLDKVHQLYAKLYPQWDGDRYQMLFTYSNEHKKGYFPITQYEL